MERAVLECMARRNEVELLSRQKRCAQHSHAPRAIRPAGNSPWGEKQVSQEVLQIKLLNGKMSSPPPDLG